MPSGIIIVNKPGGWTSHDVVAKLRGVFREKRIGHGGTLDPMATGVLPVFVGRGTRAAEFMESATKAYTAGLLLGQSTDTQDTTGRVTAKSPVNVTAEQLEKALEAFRGEIEQIPPMYSAVKIGGKKLYQIARSGGTVERKPRRVEIFNLVAASGRGSEYVLNVECSKGVYVRTLCNDIGEALGCGGCMSSLVRTRAGTYTLDEAYDLQDIIKAGEQGRAAELLMPVDSAFDCEKTVIEEKFEKPCRNGTDFPTLLPDGQYRVYAKGGEFLMLGKAENGRMATVKSFFEI